MTRLDHNRAIAQLAQKTGATVGDVTNMTIWGNHSTTQYPDLFHAKVKGQPAIELVDQAWYEDEFIPTVAKRGAAIIDARGASSAASAANAAIGHMHDWVLGTPDGDWVSMSIPSDGSYGVPEGIISSFPCTCSGGDFQIVAGPGDRRLLPRAHRCECGGAGRGAPGGLRAGPDLGLSLCPRGACAAPPGTTVPRPSRRARAAGFTNCSGCRRTRPSELAAPEISPRPPVGSRSDRARRRARWGCGGWHSPHSW